MKLIFNKLNVKYTSNIKKSKAKCLLYYIRSGESVNTAEVIAAGFSEQL